MAKPTEITLANLGGGGLMKLATAEMRRICENIADPNVRATAKRKLQISIIVEPDETRLMGKVTYSAEASIPGPDSGKAAVYIANDPEGQLGLFEMEYHRPLFEEPEPSSSVTPLSSKRA